MIKKKLNLKYSCPANNSKTKGCWLSGTGLSPSNSKSTADVLLIPEGVNDISPSLYNDRPFDSSCKFDNRDDYIELAEIYRFLKEGKKIIGIGRGAQLLCTVAGGLIVQDIGGHHKLDNNKSYKNDFIHDVCFNGDIVEQTSSAHKGLMYPFNLDRANYSILGWSYGESDETFDGKDYSHAFNQDFYLELPTEAEYFGNSIENKYTNCTLEPEVIFFRNINALAIQYNPIVNNSINKNGSLLGINIMTKELVIKFLENKL